MQDFIEIKTNTTTIYLNKRDIKYVEIADAGVSLFSVSVVYYGDEGIVNITDKLTEAQLTPLKMVLASKV